MSEMLDDVFCILPWIHMNLNPDGAATLCCQSHVAIHDEAGRALNAQTHSLPEIWNAWGMKEVRRRIQAGERLPHCEACYQNERYGRGSYRTYSNNLWLGQRDNGASLADAIEKSDDGTAPSSPMYLDLRVGNVCNLKCTACKPLYSSQIERDPVHARWITDAPYTRLANRFGAAGDWSEAPELLEEMVNISDAVCSIQLAGGEPTINRTQIGLLKALCAAERAQQIDLHVVTNLSNVRAEVYELFARFKSLTVGLSIDGIGEVYEYVRFPGKWESVVKNIEKLREAAPGARISINAVLQALNALNVVDLFDWADEANIPINLSIGRGLDVYNDFRLLPDALRDQVHSRFESYLRRKSNRDIEGVRSNIASIFAEMEATSFPNEIRSERLANFMQFVNDLDASRRLSYKRIAPEIHQGVVDFIGGWDDRTRHVGNPG